MNTVYAFCRKTDDIADNIEDSIETKRKNLKLWKEELEKSFRNDSEKTLFVSLQKIIRRFKIPKEPFFELIKGVETDLERSNFESFEELKDYCYKVASTVGLMTIPIFGYKNKSTEKYAEYLGIALQLTNIIRDVKPDAERGRIYLPKEDLKKFQYSEEELFKNVYNENFVKLMEFEVERARDFYNLADKHLPTEDKYNMFTARAMQYIYYRLLDMIVQAKYDVFSSRIRVSNFNKIFISFSVWLKYKIVEKWQSS